jgi:hypothetical protein
MNLETNSRMRRTPIALASALVLAACISPSSSLVQSADQGCPELNGGAPAQGTPALDARVRGVVQASADLRDATKSIKASVKTACANIARDLGASDTWSAIGDGDDAIHNDGRTGACDAARDRIEAIMTSDAGVRANFALSISRGACHADFDEQVKCEAGCESQEKCDPGTCQTRCEPGKVSVTCTASCTAHSFCEGHASAEANCEGSCEAECHGSCDGTCFDASGKPAQDATADCSGKCIGTCKGTCNGRCQITAEAGVVCGENVRCEGECTGQASDPICETEFSPPTCHVDVSCFESCRAHVEATAKCDPPIVKLIADVSAGGDVAKLVATIDANLPPLLLAAETQGKIVVNAATRFASSGKALLEASGSLDGHSLQCATAATKVAADSSVTLTVATQGGVDVDDACTRHAK